MKDLAYILHLVVKVGNVMARMEVTIRAAQEEDITLVP